MNRSVYNSLRSFITVTAALLAVMMLVSCSKDPVQTSDATSGSSSGVASSEQTAASSEDTTVSETTAETSGPVIPEGFTGSWTCENLASDGKTDTSFYAMNIKKVGYFSIYDQAAGNPGISGFMSNDTGSSVDCAFKTDDFDVPACWKLDSAGDTLKYELDGDTLKLGHDDVWMIFHRAEGEEEDIDYTNMPKSLDELMSVEVPGYFAPEMEYRYNDEEWTSVVERSFVSEKNGCLSIGILSYKGFDCLGDIEERIDVNEYLNTLSGKREITVGGQKGYIGKIESDDTPDMIAVVYVSYGDHVFEFRFNNYDEKITDDQMKEFEQILGTVKFLAK